MDIIVKNYSHYNRSFKHWDHPTKGKWINSKKDYLNAMARENMIPSEKAKEIAHKREMEMMRPYDGISNKAKALINSVVKGKDGKIKLSDKQIEGLKEIGYKIPTQAQASKWVTSYDKKRGGFDGE